MIGDNGGLGVYIYIGTNRGFILGGKFWDNEKENGNDNHGI